MCAGVISSVEMSSRSLGLFAAFFVSHGMFQPVSCFLISSGSSVRKRMRPRNLTVWGRFSMFRFCSDSITRIVLFAGVKDVQPHHIFRCSENHTKLSPASWRSQSIRPLRTQHYLDPRVLRKRHVLSMCDVPAIDHSSRPVETKRRSNIL